MTDPVIIDHDSSVSRQWGVIVGDQHYQADVEVIPHGCEEPPAFLVFSFAAPPEDQTITEENFLAGAIPRVAERACDLLSANLIPITEAEFVALGERNAAPKPPSPREVLLSPADLQPADFAGPNRAQRRAAAKGRH